MKRISLPSLLVACLTAVVLSACGSSSHTTHFAKTKFALHAGLALGAFHHYIYKPFKAGDFSHPLSHKVTLVKAGAAALFIRHELTLAADDVRSSKTLSKLFAPLGAAASKIDSLKNSIEHGSVSSSSLDGLQSDFKSIHKTAKSKGQAFKGQIPSAGQLTAGSL